MKRLQLHFLVLITLFLAGVPPFSVYAQDRSEERKEYYQGLPLCLPDAYLQEPGDCLPLGPSIALTEYGRIGLTFPPQPLPIRPLPSSLGIVPYQYLLLSKNSVDVYLTLQDAQARNNSRTMLPGLKYLAYKQRVEISDSVFYQFQTGEWVRGESVESRVGYSTASRGVLLTGVPRTTFGWTIEEVETRTEPGLKGRPTGHKIPIYAVIWAYTSRKVDGFNWVMVGLNEWIEDRLLAKVSYDPTPPKGVTSGRWANLNLTEQTLAVYDQSRLVFAALAATGVKKMATRPGLFQASKKVPAEHMTGSFEADRSDFYYLESVPWTVYFDEARAIHGVYWRTNFGRPASHGCVNLTIADSRWFYDWIEEGDFILVSE